MLKQKLFITFISNFFSYFLTKNEFEKIEIYPKDIFDLIIGFLKHSFQVTSNPMRDRYWEFKKKIQNSFQVLRRNILQELVHL